MAARRRSAVDEGSAALNDQLDRHLARLRPVVDRAELALAERVAAVLRRLVVIPG